MSWRKIADIRTGAVAREMEVAKRLKEHYNGKVPVVVTVFTPLTYSDITLIADLKF